MDHVGGSELNLAPVTGNVATKETVKSLLLDRAFVLQNYRNAEKWNALQVRPVQPCAPVCPWDAGAVPKNGADLSPPRMRYKGGGLRGGSKSG